MKSRILILLSCFMLLAANVRANNLGVNVHTGWHSVQDIERHAEGLHAGYIRDTLNWSYVEKQKGEYHIDEREDYYKNMDDYGKTVIIILAFGNPLYYGDGDKYMPVKSNSEYYNAWLEYVRFVAETFKGRNFVYEVWNEPNLTNFNVNASASDYGALFSDTYDVIKGIDPSAFVLGGSIANVGSNALGFLEEFYVNGGNKMDALSYHLYTHASSPEEDYKSGLDALEESLDSLGYTGPVWMTENGYYTGTQTNSKSEELQASYAVRQTVIWDDYLRRSGREGCNIWYDLIDDGADAADAEDNFGLVRADGTRKPSYYAVQTYNRFLGGKNIQSLTKVQSSGDNYTYIAKYTDGDHITYVAWNTGENSGVTVTPGGDEAALYSCTGEKLNNVTGKTLTFRVGQSPKFVDCISYETTIESVEYDKEKGVATVSGKCNYSDYVTVETELDGAVLNSSLAEVQGGRFSAEISVLEKGEITIYAGRAEAGDEYAFASESLTVSGDGEEDCKLGNVLLDMQSGELYVSGEAYGCGGCTIAVIAAGCDVENIREEDIAYVGYAEVIDNSFSQRIDLSDSPGGEYRILIGSERLEEVYESAYVAGSAIYDIVTAVNGNEVSVSGKFAGEDELCTIAVVPEGTDLENIQPENIAYLGVTPVTDKRFLHQFTMPDIYGGRYKILIGSAGTAAPEEVIMQIGTAVTNARVCSLELSDTDGVIKIMADLNNVNPTQNSAIIFLAQYDANDRLTGLSMRHEEISENTVVPSAIEFSAPRKAGAVKMKGFIFDGASSLIPLCDFVEKMLIWRDVHDF